MNRKTKTSRSRGYRSFASNGRLRRTCAGGSSFNLLWMIPLAVIFVLAGVVVFYEGRKAYWDYQVREMCAKDGGVKISEVIVLSPREAKAMPKNGGYIGVGPESLASPQVPVFYRVKEAKYREWNPRVSREEKEIVRRSDGRVIATSVVYGRGGGDVPSFAFPSVFYCPDLGQEMKEIDRIFRIEGEAK